MRTGNCVLACIVRLRSEMTFGGPHPHADRRGEPAASPALGKFEVSPLRLLLFKPGDLGALQTHARHQSLLAENEGIGVAGQRLRCE